MGLLPTMTKRSSGDLGVSVPQADTDRGNYIKPAIVYPASPLNKEGHIHFLKMNRDTEQCRGDI